MRPTETLQDVIEEAKTRTGLWATGVFAITYFLSHTSKMWTNIPISINLSFEVELHWRVWPNNRQTYISLLEKKQLSVNDSRLSNVPPMSKWRRKIDSPHVEAAVDDFINKILQDFVVDLWYSSITLDKEAPELIQVLQCIVGGILAVVMRPQEAKCSLVRCISRELLTCLVLQPLMNLASPMIFYQSQMWQSNMKRGIS